MLLYAKEFTATQAERAAGLQRGFEPGNWGSDWGFVAAGIFVVFIAAIIWMATRPKTAPKPTQKIDQKNKT